MVPKLPLQLLGLQHAYHFLWWRRRAATMPFINAWNRDHDAIFVHIPKTAGTSLFEALGLAPASDTHAPARAYRRADRALFERAFTFSIVRNPWDRFASSFHFLKSGTDWSMQQAWARRHIGDLDFAGFVRKLRTPLFRASIRAERFFWPQSFWITDGRGRSIVDRLYRFEDLAAATDDLCDRLALPRPAALPHRRRSRTGDYRDLYDPVTRRIVGDFYRDDIRLLKYEF